MTMTTWQNATKEMYKKHPRCEGSSCNSWDTCNIYEIMIKGCIYYTREIQEQMIEDEIKHLISFIK